MICRKCKVEIPVSWTDLCSDCFWNSSDELKRIKTGLLDLDRQLEEEQMATHIIKEDS